MSVFSILCHHDSLEHPVITFYKVHKTEVNRTNCYVLLTVHANVMMSFFTNLVHKFYILIHLLHSSTYFEHNYAHLQEDKLC